MAYPVKWTPEIEEALKDMHSRLSYVEIMQKLNAQFGTNFTLNAVRHRAGKLGLTDNSSWNIYTEAQDEWLRQNISKYTYTDLVGNFNETFNTNIGYYALKCHCIKKGYKGGCAEDKGYRPPRCPIGTERIIGGYIWVKVSDLPRPRGCKDHMYNWVQKGRWVWEQHYGEIPEGYNIVYLDGNTLNCDISNLECTTANIQGYVAGGRFNQADPQLKRCAIKMKTLEKILEEVYEGSEND